MNKSWGTSELLVEGHNFEAHRLEIRSGGQCSLHLHRRKYSMIRVERGTLWIDMPDGRQIVEAGQSISIPPGLKHRFTAPEDTVAYEFYWLSDIEPDDIVRFA